LTKGGLMTRKVGLRPEEIIVNLIYWPAVIFIGIYCKFRGIELLCYIGAVLLLYIGILSMLAIDHFIP